VIVVESVQKPEIVPAHAPNLGSPGSERSLEVPTAWQIARRERTHGGGYRTISGRPGTHAQPLHASPKRAAHPEDSSGHGHFPAAMQRSSCSIVSSMKSPRAKSASACRSSSSSSACFASCVLFTAAVGVAMPCTLPLYCVAVTKPAVAVMVAALVGGRNSEAANCTREATRTVCRPRARSRCAIFLGLVFLHVARAEPIRSSSYPATRPTSHRVLATAFGLIE